MVSRERRTTEGKPANLKRRRVLQRLPRLGVVVLVLALGRGGAARAHDESVSTSEVTVIGARVVWRVDLGLAGLAKVVTLPTPEANLDAAALSTVAPEIAAVAAGGLRVVADGRTLTAQPAAPEPQTELVDGRPVIARVIQPLVYTAPTPIERLQVRVAFFERLTRAHRAVVTVTWGESVHQFVRLGPTELTLSGRAGSGSAWAALGEFFLWGVQHIFLGYDHIAFLLALLLAVTSLRGLLGIVTCFTAAHSLTLLLAALGVLSFPSRLTEVLIAASIVYVAAENLTWRTHARRLRWLLTFAFGLVHGLGFATELRARLAETGAHMVASVVCFNLGVEAGQLAIVAVCFPLLRYATRAGTHAHRRLVFWGSLPILGLGLWWLAERLGG